MPEPISLVITVYNRERYLSAAIESVLAQTRQDFELLIWDDGSTDSSVEIAKEYAKRDRRIRVVASEHRGQTASLNAAIAQTKGCYIGSVDSDDLLAPTALEETVAVLEANPEVGWVYTDYIDIDKNSKFIGYGKRCHIPYSKQRLLVDFMTFHFRLIRRQAFEQVGGFDESCLYAEDYDLCLKLSEVTQVRHIKKPLYYYRSHQASITNQYQSQQAQDCHGAIERAIKRRGLSDSCQVSLEVLKQFPFKSRIKIAVKKVSSLVLAALPLVGAMATRPVLAQSITSAGDAFGGSRSDHRTNTLVTPDGNRIDITGGRLSRDGANLFHSFNKFGLDSNQTANFISTPSIQNILGRVNGGQPSVINGLIQVTGGNSNLYLMNPSGIIFGANARLNVPADFTATTATSIGIGNGWFNAKGNNNYRDLVGTPNSFVFYTAQPGAIVNAGVLGVDAGKNLALVGGTVINTGTLTAPGGNITVAAVPGESMVRLSQPGYLLSLEVPASTTSGTGSGNWTVPILSLPQLLTGPGAQQATGVSVNSNGQVVLTSSGIQVPSDTGTTIVSGSIDTSSDQIGGRVNVLGDKVGLASANINASGTQGGGAVLIGGDYQGKGSVPNASRTYVSRDSVIAADAGVEGNGGRVIVWADRNNEFFGNISVRGGSNSGNGGFVEVSGKQNLTFDGTVDLKAEKGNAGTLLLDPVDITIVAGIYGGTDDAQLNDRQILANDSPTQSFTISESALENAAFTGGVTLQATNNITINNLPDNALTFVAAGYGYNPGSITFTADADNNGVGSFVMNPGDTIEALGRTITISGASVNVGSIVPSLAQGNAGSLNITATNGDIIVNGYLNATSINAQAGTITLRAPNGNITINNSALDSRSTLGNGADILLEASGNITTGTLQSNVEGNAAFNGGNITLISTAGSINTSAGIVQSFSGGGNGGAITLTANGNITTGALSSYSAAGQGTAGNGGVITLNATNGNITTTGDLNSSSSGRATTGNGGAITLAAGNGITITGNLNSSNFVRSGAGNGGAIALTAGNGITVTGDLNSYSFTNLPTAGNGGAIALTTANGNISTGNLNSYSSNTSGSAGSGGAVILDAANSITTSSINNFANPSLGSVTNYGNISLTGNEINFTGGANTVRGDNTILLLQPKTPGQAIAITGATDSGTNTLDLTATDLTAISNGFTSITIGRADGTGTITLNPFNFNAPVNIAGGSTLVGANQNTTWTITGTNAGSISGFPNGLTFSSIQNLTGGTGNDRFVFQNGASISGAISGGAGTDTLNYSAYTTPLTVNLATLGAVSIEQVIGTTAAPSTLIGANTANTWNITASNSGTVNGTLNFIAFDNLTGGNNNDTFVFSKGKGVNGTIDGAGGSNTLNYSAYTIPVTVNLAANTATGVGGSISNIQNAIGGTGTNTLIGSNSSNTWNITGTNSGDINGTFTFTAFGNLKGGNLDDTFALNGGSATTINGGGGSNTLIGDNTVNTWNITSADSGNVNSTTSFSAIQNLTAGNLDDTIQFSQGASISGNINGRAGNLILTGDELNFAGQVSGTGNLTLQPLTPTQAIQIGGTDSGTSSILALTGTKLSLLQNGFTSIAIGRADGSGTITLAGDVTFKDPVTLRSTNGSGSINYTGGTLTGSDNASITLLAAGNITTGNITANPGITIVSTNGSIDTTSGLLDSSATSSKGGAIALSAAGNITTNNITSRSNLSTAGDITLNSQTGTVRSGNLDASGNTLGGKITVIAKDQIVAGQINSSASLGNGGDVKLDPIGDIQVNSINAQGGSQGRGGNVDITTASLFRSQGTFTDKNGVNASISTAGGIDGGDIIIRHGGGARDIPFQVGNATTNGTAGAITTSSINSILPDQSFPGSYSQGNIQIITQNPSPTPPPPTSSPSPKPNTDGISKDIQGRTPVSTGINTINATAKVLLDTTAIGRIDIDQALASGQVEKAISLIEQLRTQEFQNYFEGNLAVPSTESVSVEQTQTLLSDIASNTGKTPAVIYVFAQPDQLQLILVTPKGKPLLRTVYETNSAALRKMVTEFRSQVTDPRKKTGYQAVAKQLYQWLIVPLETELQTQKIDTLVFSMDTGLRSLPLAALYDGQKFLVEKYSIGLIPNINLVDTRYRDVKTVEVLAMGASKFPDQNALPAVPVELSTIVGERNKAAQNREQLPTGQSSLITSGLWSGQSFLNQAFTLENLKSQRAQKPFGIIHLATHGEFKLGAPRNSYIQLWDTKLQLDQLRKLGWNNPPVELLVLSACRTAVGDEQAEFGFGGLAVAAGVKSAVASLWYVSDEGTLGLMSEFYQQLKTAPIKAEALRQAQIAMIKGEVRIEGGKLRLPGEHGFVSLPPELAQDSDKQLSHPAYWAAFTMIGSPW